MIFLAFIGLTIWSSISAKRDVEAKQNQILVQKIEDNKRIMESRIATYEDILRSAKGLFGASNEVTRAEWREFVETFELEKRYTGVQAMGYAEVIPLAKLNSHLKSVRSSEMPNYNIVPAGNRPVYVSIRYIESTGLDANDIDKNIGFDIYTDANRQAAMDQARDSGKPIISDIVQPLKMSSRQPDKALVMYVPIYQDGVKPLTVEQRRDTLTGFSFFGFFPENLVSQNEGSQDYNFGFAVYDGEINGQSLLYQSPTYESVNALADKQTTTQAMAINNQKWQISGSVSPEVISSQDRARPSTTLWGGTLFSIFVASFIYMLLLNRSRIGFEQEQREIQEAKDELLALASHQLRTPATGVKQYIGLLREGYAGKLNKEQKIYVERAYANNERQLGTINKMLFVARANAKKIDLKLERIEIRGLAMSTIDDLDEAIKENNHTLVTDFPSKKTYIEADSKYLRMCLENILHNAVKYTPDKGKIRFSIRKIKNEMVIKISDTGVGVAEKDFPLLFRKFSRVPNELTSKVSGSGIGLYLACKVVNAHGGTIEFESELGEGTTFIIKLPVKQKP